MLVHREQVEQVEGRLAGGPRSLLRAREVGGSDCGYLETRVLAPRPCRELKAYLKEIGCIDYTRTGSAFSGKQFQSHFILHLHLANGLIIATLITFKHSQGQPWL